MNRTETIFELAKYCHQDWYKNILGWPTWGLQALLAYYESGEVPARVPNMTIDFRFSWYITEPLKNKMRLNDMRPRV